MTDSSFEAIYTFPAILVVKDDSNNATQITNSEVQFKLEEALPFSYSYGNSFQFPGGEVFQINIESGTIYDEISFPGYNDSFEAYQQIISQFTSTSDENYVLLEIPSSLNGQGYNVLAVIYAEGDHFDRMTTLDDWYDGSARQSQGEVVKPEFQPNRDIDFRYWAESTLTNPQTEVPTDPDATVSEVTVIVELLGNTLMLEGLNETLTDTSHTITHNGQSYDYSSIDSFTSIVARDGNFTDEFAQEIADAYPSVAGITYSAALGLIGSENWEATILGVAGADGNYVG
ncbi:hypothetical protein N9W43_08735 [Litoricolaceae bacterium]|nr:hypothetical protein [Litorivicinaceae bacterium]